MEKLSVLVTGYKRPGNLNNLLNQISLHSNVDLYIAIDGPKTQSNDLPLVNYCREIARNAKKNFNAKVLIHEKNLGCRAGMTDSINWFFQKIEKGVILEDDLKLHSDFFDFMERSLNHFEKDDSVGSVTGYNATPLSQITNQEKLGYFTNFSSSWGWGTWRDRWEKNLTDLTNWEELITKKKLKSLGGKNGMKRWVNTFNRVQKEELDSWAYPWLLTQWINDYSTFTSSKNLIENLGFNDKATHTKIGQSAPLYQGKIDFETKLPELKHNIDYIAEEWILKNRFFVHSDIEKIKFKISNLRTIGS